MTQSNVPPPPDPTDPYDTAPAAAPPPPPNAAMLNPTPTPLPPPAPGEVGYEGPTGYPGAYVGPEPTGEAKTMALVAHLLNILFLVPLLVWLLKKDSHPYVNDQGKEATNFSLICLIIHVVCSFTFFLCVPALISMALVVVQIVFGIMGAVAANKGEAFRYPVNVRLIK